MIRKVHAQAGHMSGEKLKYFLSQSSIIWDKKVMKEELEKLARECEGCTLAPLMCSPDAWTLFGAPWCPIVRSVAIGGMPGHISALSYMCSGPSFGQVLQHTWHCIMCPSIVVWCPNLSNIPHLSARPTLGFGSRLGDFVRKC